RLRSGICTNGTYIVRDLVGKFDSSIPYFFFNDPATTEIYTLSLHDALPISADVGRYFVSVSCAGCHDLNAPRPTEDGKQVALRRSEEHTSELQSRRDLVCRLLLEKKKRHLGHRIGSEMGRRQYSDAGIRGRW